MKQLTDTEKLEIAVNLLDKQGLVEYEEQCYGLEVDCERNGFYNIPAECEDVECADCPFDPNAQVSRGCPYVD